MRLFFALHVFFPSKQNLIRTSAQDITYRETRNLHNHDGNGKLLCFLLAMLIKILYSEGPVSQFTLELFSSH